MVLDATKVDYSPLSAAYFNELEEAIQNSLHGKDIVTISNVADDSPTYYIDGSAWDFKDAIEDAADNVTIVIMGNGADYTVADIAGVNVGDNVTMIGINRPVITGAGDLLIVKNFYISSVDFVLPGQASCIHYEGPPGTAYVGMVYDCNFELSGSASPDNSGNAIARTDMNGSEKNEKIIIKGNTCLNTGEGTRFISGTYFINWIVTENIISSEGIANSYFIFGSRPNGLIISNNHIRTQVDNINHGVIYLYGYSNRTTINNNNFFAYHDIVGPHDSLGVHINIREGAYNIIDGNTFTGLSTVLKVGVDTNNLYTDGVFTNNACELADPPSGNMSIIEAVYANNLIVEGNIFKYVSDTLHDSWINMGGHSTFVEPGCKFTDNTVDFDNVNLVFHMGIKTIVSDNSITVHDGSIELWVQDYALVSGNTILAYDANFGLISEQYTVFSDNVLDMVGPISLTLDRHSILTSNTIHFGGGIDIVIQNNGTIDGNRFFEKDGGTGDFKINNATPYGALNISNNLLDSHNTSAGVFRINGTNNNIISNNILDVAFRTLDIDLLNGNLISANRFLQQNEGTEQFNIDCGVYNVFSDNNVGVTAQGGGHIHLHDHGTIVGNMLWGNVGAIQTIEDGAGGDDLVVVGNKVGSWIDAVNGPNTVKNYNPPWANTSNALNHAHGGGSDGGFVSIGNLTGSAGFVGHLYAGHSSGNLTPLGSEGSSGQILRSNGAGVVPSWSNEGLALVHNNIGDIDGGDGTGGTYNFHLTQAEHTDLTDGGNSISHKHDHNSYVTGLQGGDASNRWHATADQKNGFLTSTQKTDLTDSGNTTLHAHDLYATYAYSESSNAYLHSSDGTDHTTSRTFTLPPGRWVVRMTANIRAVTETSSTIHFSVKALIKLGTDGETGLPNYNSEWERQKQVSSTSDMWSQATWEGVVDGDQTMRLRMEAIMSNGSGSNDNLLVSGVQYSWSRCVDAVPI